MVTPWKVVVTNASASRRVRLVRGVGAGAARTATQKRRGGFPRVSSEAWGGRSANRGQCAQQCRMPYALLVDGVLTKLPHDAAYLLSPQGRSDGVPFMGRSGRLNENHDRATADLAARPDL